MSEGPRYFGKYRATVLNNLDPRSQGRIQVQLGDQYGPFPSTWALPAFPMAAKGCAMVALPQIGSLVWIEFEAGDPDYPIWTGAFWDTAGGFPAAAVAAGTPATPAIHMETSLGTSVTLSDNPAQQVAIKTIQGAKIVIAATGITLDNGLGAKIELIGPTVQINGTALMIT